LCGENETIAEVLFLVTTNNSRPDIFVSVTGFRTSIARFVLYDCSQTTGYRFPFGRYRAKNAECCGSQHLGLSPASGINE